MNPIYLAFALVLGLWLLWDFLSGSIKFYPGRFYGRSVEFTREEDGPIYWLLVLIKGAVVIYLLLKGVRVV